MLANIIKREPISTSIRLNELMKEKSLSCKKLAQELNFEEKTVQKWKKGGNIRKSNLQILANYFDVDVEYLLCKQVKRKKEKWDILEEKQLQEDIDAYYGSAEYLYNEAIKKLVKQSLGYEINVVGHNAIPHQSQHIYNGELITTLDYVDTETKISIENKYGEEIFISNRKYIEFKQDIIDYIEFKINKLKNMSDKEIDQDNDRDRLDIANEFDIIED